MALLDIEGDFTSLMMIPPIVVCLGLVYCHLTLALLNKDCMLWHFRLGHPNFTYMQYLFPHLFSKLDVSSLSCDMCIRAKQHRVSFPSQPYKPTQPSTLIHSDVWGPSKVTTSSGKRWFVTFIDDHTRLTWVYLITDKSEVSSIFQNFYHTIET